MFIHEVLLDQCLGETGAAVDLHFARTALLKLGHGRNDQKQKRPRFHTHSYSIQQYPAVSVGLKILGDSWAEIHFLFLILLAY